MGSKPLKDAYPGLYLTSFDHGIYVAEAIEKDWDNFSSRRTLYGESLELWNSLKSRCEDIQIPGGEDRIKWMLTADGKFSVKSLYMFWLKLIVVSHKNSCGKLKYLLRSKKNLWLMNRKSILTKDYLLKRGWNGDKVVPFVVRMKA